MANSIVPFSKELAQQLIDSGDRFPVDFDLAWVWLGYKRRFDAERKMLKHFGLNADYASDGASTPSTGGKSVEKYRLSVDAFKMMGMMAGTEKGREVREYFLECERIAKASQPKSDAMTTLEVMANSIALLQQHESRLSLIEQQNQLLIEENQYLKQQVALLTLSQEAIELETEANAVELQRYKNGHGRYYTIAAWCNLHGYCKSLQEMNTIGRKASAMCRIQEIVPQPVQDPRWGVVNSYPDRILEELDFS